MGNQLAYLFGDQQKRFEFLPHHKQYIYTKDTPQIINLNFHLYITHIQTHTNTCAHYILKKTHNHATIKIRWICKKRKRKRTRTIIHIEIQNLLFVDCVCVTKKNKKRHLFNITIYYYKENGKRRQFICDNCIGLSRDISDTPFRPERLKKGITIFNKLFT